MMKLVEQTVLAGKTEVLGKNLPRCHFVHQKSHLPDPGANPSRCGVKPATNRFSYGADMSWLLNLIKGRTNTVNCSYYFFFTKTY
jgi:hypothetical protein